MTDQVGEPVLAICKRGLEVEGDLSIGVVAFWW